MTLAESRCKQENSLPCIDCLNLHILSNGKSKINVFYSNGMYLPGKKFHSPGKVRFNGNIVLDCDDFDDIFNFFIFALFVYILNGTFFLLIIPRKKDNLLRFTVLFTACKNIYYFLSYIDFSDTTQN